MFDELIKIIETIKNKIPDGSDMVWTGYETPKEFRDDLVKYITRLKKNDKECLKDLNILFAPTGSIQEHSIANGWADEFLQLSGKFDKIYHDLK